MVIQQELEEVATRENSPRVDAQFETYANFAPLNKFVISSLQYDAITWNTTEICSL